MTPPWTAVRQWAQTMLGSTAGWSLFAIIVLSLSGDYLVLEFGAPAIFRRLPELLILFLLIYRLADPRFPIRLPATFAILGVTAVAAAIVALMNDQDPFRTATGARNLLRYPLLGFVVANLRLTPHMRNAIWGLLATLVAVQVPWTLYQWGVLGREDDGVFGTLRSTGSLAVLLLIGVLAVCAQLVYLRRHPLWLLALPLAAVPPLIGEGKAFFLLVPIALMTAFFGSVRHRPGIAVLVTTAGILTMGYVATLFERVQGQDDIIAFAAAKVRDPFTDTGLSAEISQAGRINELIDGVALALTNGGFGEGLGARAVFAEEVEDEFTATRALLTTSMSVRMQELGVIGTGLYLLAMLAAIIGCGRRLRAAATPSDAFCAAVAIFVTIIMVPVLFYTNVDVPSVALMQWLPVGLAFGIPPRLRANAPVRQTLARHRASPAAPPSTLPADAPAPASRRPTWSRG